VKCGRSFPIFRSNVLSPSSGTNSKTSDEAASRVMLVSCLLCYSTLKMDAVRSSETKRSKSGRVKSVKVGLHDA
jgi:hypothetical protein